MTGPSGGLTRIIVALVLTALVVVVAGALLGGTASTVNLDTALPAGPFGIVQAAGLLFFAFAGHARLATLGEEVVDPTTTIPRAVPIALSMARRRELPGVLDAVHPTYRTPHRAELTVAVVVCGVMLVADLRERSGSPPSPC